MLVILVTFDGGSCAAQVVNTLVSFTASFQFAAVEIDVRALDCVGQPIANLRAIAAPDANPEVVPSVYPVPEQLPVLFTVLCPDGSALHGAILGMQLIIDPADVAKGPR